jgi:hypothetical protein
VSHVHAPGPSSGQVLGHTRCGGYTIAGESKADGCDPIGVQAPVNGLHE